MNKTVYIDGLFYKESGIGRYYSTLIKLLKRHIKLLTCIHKKKLESFQKEFEKTNLNLLLTNYEKFSIKGFIYHSIKLKNLKNCIKIFHFPHVNIPLYTPQPLIVTIHDLIPFSKYWDRNKLKLIIFKLYFDLAIKRADKIVTVSNFTKHELIKYIETNFNKDVSDKIKNKTITIYNTVDPFFINNNHKKIRNQEDKILLFIGNRKKHKNLTTLIKSIHIISKYKENVKLIIAGKKEKNVDEIDLLINKLNIKEKIIEFHNINDIELKKLYNKVLALVFPSLYEGFGLPLIEAMACNCPIIASSIPVIKEICNDAAIYFDPLNPEDLAEKILLLIKNKDLVEELIHRGNIRLKVFKNETFEENYLKLYNSLMD